MGGSECDIRVVSVAFCRTLRRVHARGAPWKTPERLVASRDVRNLPVILIYYDTSPNGRSYARRGRLRRTPAKSARFESGPTLDIFRPTDFRVSGEWFDCIVFYLPSFIDVYMLAIYARAFASKLRGDREEFGLDW